MPAGCWWKPPGTTAPAIGPGKTMRARWELASASRPARGDAGNRRLHDRWVTFNVRRKRPVIANVADRPRTRRLVLVAGRHGLTRTSKTASSTGPVVAARGATRDAAMSSQTSGWRRSSPRHAASSCRTARPAVTNPRISA